jgi:hypothetical protein
MTQSAFLPRGLPAEQRSEDAAVTAILLFGSRARRDEARGSDTDLLLVVPNGEPKHISRDNFSMFLYAWPKLVADAEQGDLFVCHLVKEAEPIFDPGNRLGQLRAAFRLRSDYADVIRHACDLGWFLDRFGHELDTGIVARRMIWCTRTILIAKSAQAGNPTFAPHALAAFSVSQAAADLLAARHQRRVDAQLRTRFRRFLADECKGEHWHLTAQMADYLSHFAATGNRVAMQTLRQSEERGTYG